MKINSEITHFSLKIMFILECQAENLSSLDLHAALLSSSR